MESFIKSQQEKRAQAWEQAKSMLDAAAAEGRDLTAEETQSYEAITKELDERSKLIEQVREDVVREARAAELRLPETASVAKRSERPSDEEMLRSLIRGEMRAANFQRRDLVTNVAGDGPELVPQGFYDVLQAQLVYAGPMLEPGLATILRTDMGNDIKVPRQTAFSAATATAEAAVFGESDPQFQSFTLRAHKFGALVQVSRELLEDSGIPVVQFIAEQFGVALGTAVNNALTLGTGTIQPRGIAVAAGSGITGGTATGAFTADNLIDLAHSINSAVARRPGIAFMANRATVGAIRKLKDDAGQYLYQPGVGQPDSLLGVRIVENPDLGNIGTGVRSVLFGDFSSYHVRLVGAGIEVARSDDYAFANDLVTFRASIRVDGDLGQSQHVKYFVGG
jgi:HK97 family phage major capsid protein